MKIKQVSCTQFAGIQDKAISFSDGLNILVGNNETGKSTLVELIYQLLFHDINTKKSEKTEKDFQLLYYPKGIGTVGDYADGRLTFDAGGGTYNLEKCWGAGSYARLTTPNNIRLQDQSSIKQIVRDLLQFRKGLYDDVIFSSQRQQQEIVDHIFQSFSDSKKTPATKDKKQSDAKADLVSILTQERIQNAGFDLNVFENELNKIIADFEGCWDTEKDAPRISSLRTKKAGGTPPNEGRLFSAYFLVDQLSQLLADSEKAERAVERDLKDLKVQEIKRDAILAKREDFEQYTSLLSEYTANRVLASQLKEDIKRRRQAAKDYPGLKRAYSKAVKLRQQLRDEEAWVLYDDILRKRNEWLIWVNKMDGREEISRRDITSAKGLEQDILRCKRECYGIDLLAELENTGFNNITIRSAIDGRELYSSTRHGDKRKFEIAEPVEISIPGVMRLRLSDVGKTVKGKDDNLRSLEQQFDSILQKYDDTITTVDQLMDLQAQYTRDEYELRRSEIRYKDALGGRNWEVMEETFQNLSKRKKRRPIAEIKEDITQLCGEKNIEAYCGELESSIKYIEDAYQAELGEITPDALRASVESVEEKLQAAQDAVVKVDQIPVQYRKKNVAEYRSQLKESLVPIDDKIQEIQGRLKEDEKFLGEKTAEELSLELDQAKNEFIRVQTDYRHWLHIREVYQKAKLSLEEDSEIKDVERRFAKNLQLITGGKVVLQSLNGTMDVSITSGTNRLAEEILSEGTRDTIALAFRLAMMEHLFPDGGGLLVLDDPFTEMDPVRTKKACELLQAFADNGNQVIFVTCDKKYSSLMSGNVIQV